MQTRYWDFSEIDSTEYMNNIIRAMLVNQDVGPASSPVKRPGVLTGFVATANGTPDNKVNLDRGGFGISSAITEPGVIVIEDADLSDPVTFDPVDANPRIDIVVLKHEYRDFLPSLPASYSIVKGVAAATPTPAYGNVGLDETPIAEVWIDTAPGVGNPAVIQTAHIKNLPSCLSMLVANHEQTFGKTNNADGDSGAWVSMGKNTDRFYIMRDPDDDNQVFMVLNAYYTPTDGKWYQEDVTRGSVLAKYNGTTGIVDVWGVYHAAAGTVAAVFATFWLELVTLDTLGNMEFNNNLGQGITGYLSFDATQDVIATAGSNFRPAVATTGLNKICEVHTLGSPSRLTLTASIDEGQAYAAPATILTRVDSTIIYDGIGMEAIGSQTLVVAYYDEDTIGGFYGVYALRSTDNGVTWGSPITIIDENETGVSSIPYPDNGEDVVLMPNGNLIAAFVYLDGANYKLATKVSTDNGLTWGTKQLAHSTVNTIGAPRLVATPSGRLICLVYNNTTNNILSLYSDDQGATWSVPVTVATTTVPSPSACSYTLFYDSLGTKVYALYSSTNAPPNSVRAKISVNAGVSWGEELYPWARSPGASIISFAITLTTLGRLILFYEDNSANIEQIRGTLTAVAHKV